jgi:hypothetical protein
MTLPAQRECQVNQHCVGWADAPPSRFYHVASVRAFELDWVLAALFFWVHHTRCRMLGRGSATFRRWPR